MKMNLLKNTMKYNYILNKYSLKYNVKMHVNMKNANSIYDLPIIDSKGHKKWYKMVNCIEIMIYLQLLK